MFIPFENRLRAAFAPPRYLSPPLAGVDISTSGVKAVRLADGAHGLSLEGYAEARLAAGAFADGEIVDHDAVAKAIGEAMKAAGVYGAAVGLPESKSYLFETSAPGATRNAWRTAVEQHLDELVPLPPAETAFDIVPLGVGADGQMRLAGVGLAHRVIDQILGVCDDSRLLVRALEGETFAMARALLPAGDETATLLIDVGKTTTKIAFVERLVPRFATTIAIGGHALTLAVQKHFGVTELEARRVKAERGIVPAPGNEDYLAAMLSTVSAIRDEITRRLEYWQKRAKDTGRMPITRAILAGGNASVRGLSEYLEGALRLPVISGDVFANFASRDYWLPSLSYPESLAYATAIGLALRDRDFS